MSFSTFRVSRGTLALALHDQVTPELAQFLRDRLGARQVVGEGVVVEEEFPHLREIALRQRDLLGDVPRRAHAVAMSADGLRPQAEGAARFAAAAGVQRHVGVQQVADEVVLDPQVALVDLGHERQLVHVLQDRAVLVVLDARHWRRGRRCRRSRPSRGPRRFP